MPRISINVIARGHPLDQDILSFDLALDLTVASLKGFITAESNIAADSQQLFHNNSVLRDDQKTLEQSGVKDGDMIVVLLHQTPQANSMGSQRPSQQQLQSRQPQRDEYRRGMETDPLEIETTRLNILGNSNAMAQVRELRPALAEAINDKDRFRDVWMQMNREHTDREQERNEQIQLLNHDPFNIEAQRKIEELIRQEAVQENLQKAYTYNPEVFGRVTMLYIPVIVNNHPVKAFVDSGAQTTIMSPSCAEACNIMRLIDRRYAGIAKGVGTAQILGRVHSADISIGTAAMSCSFTVMEGKDVDLLLGLDMLKRFQATIDLKRNMLIFGDDNEVSFLGEADIPKYLDEAQQAEPTISGPGGTEIGTQTGTVKPAGTSAAAASSSAFQGQGQTVGSSSDSRAPVVDASSGSVSSGSRHPDESIQQLQNLGFSYQEAVAALDACNGNVEYAAGLLFQG